MPALYISSQQYIFLFLWQNVRRFFKWRLFVIKMNDCSLHHNKRWAVKLTRNIVSVFMTTFPFPLAWSVAWSLAWSVALAFASAVAWALTWAVAWSPPKKQIAWVVYVVKNLWFQKLIFMFWFFMLDSFFCGHDFLLQMLGGVYPPYIYHPSQWYTNTRLLWLKTSKLQLQIEV